VRPSLGLFSFDGYTWLRDDVPLSGGHARGHTVGAGDARHAIACQATATYSPPFVVSIRAASPPVKVPGGG
jgi:hypothetical protein